MQILVDLQDFIITPIILLLFIILAILIMTIYILTHNKNKEEVEEKVEIKEAPLKDRQVIIQKYLKKLNELEEKIDKIELRISYQKLSNIIRYFVYEVTNIKVQNYTLKEIKEINMLNLYELVEEYYKPEFAKQSLGDIKASIDKTRKVIEKWN